MCDFLFRAVPPFLSREEVAEVSTNAAVARQRELDERRSTAAAGSRPTRDGVGEGMGGGGDDEAGLAGWRCEAERARPAGTTTKTAEGSSARYVNRTRRFESHYGLQRESHAAQLMAIAPSTALDCVLLAENERDVIKQRLNEAVLYHSCIHARRARNALDQLDAEDGRGLRLASAASAASLLSDGGSIKQLKGPIVEVWARHSAFYLQLPLWYCAECEKAGDAAAPSPFILECLPSSPTATRGPTLAAKLGYTKWVRFDMLRDFDGFTIESGEKQSPGVYANHLRRTYERTANCARDVKAAGDWRVPTISAVHVRHTYRPYYLIEHLLRNWEKDALNFCAGVTSACPSCADQIATATVGPDGRPDINRFLSFILDGCYSMGHHASAAPTARAAGFKPELRRFFGDVNDQAQERLQRSSAAGAGPSSAATAWHNHLNCSKSRVRFFLSKAEGRVNR